VGSVAILTFNLILVSALVCLFRHVLLHTGLLSAAFAQGTLSVTHTGPFPGPAVVEIPWANVRQAYPRLDTARLRIVDSRTKQEVPYQFERRGQPTIQQLLVLVALNPGQSTTLQLLPGRPAPVRPLTYARHVPERYDDFAWENDRIAFRIYGAALASRSDNAFGTDVWSKRTDQLIINRWYKTGDYHADHGEGLDYYKVGFTLGAGDLAVLLPDTLGYIHNYREWEILDNGPLRSTFRVQYAPQTFKGVTVRLTKTISLDAGAQLSRVEVQLAHDSPTPLPVALGLNLRPEPGQLLLNEQAGLLGYWEPVHGKDGTLGLGLVLAQGAAPMHRQYGHAFMQLRLASDQPLVYFQGAAWDKAGRITSAEAWFDYLRRFAAGRQTP